MHSKSFLALEPYLKKIDRLTHLSAILYYDIMTICPEKGISDESDLDDSIKNEIAEIYADKEFSSLLKAALKDETATKEEKLLYESLYKQIDLVEKIGLKKYGEYQSAISASNQAWRKYRPLNDFKSFLPSWKKLVEVSRSVADAKRKPGMKTRYDAFLNDYEPGESEEYLDGVFEPLKKSLISLLKVAKINQKSYVIPTLKPYDENHQRAFATAILKEIGYDMKGGCLETSAHPFSTDIYQCDARLTTKYLIEDWRSNAFTCLHEGGHCLEFQNKPALQYENCIQSLSTAAICETHSRFYENIIGRSLAFAPILKKLAAENLDSAFEKMDDEVFYHLLNKVEPWTIRCEADELSYSLHIIIRYEIEKDLINGKIECEDVPTIWNKKYLDYLGVKVPNDSEGCMQDTHWSEALFGYFPSYALGNLYGAMIKEKMEKDIGFEELVEHNQMGKILAYLKEKDFAIDYLHPDEWIKRVTGESLSSDAYIRYLTKKFAE